MIQNRRTKNRKRKIHNRKKATENEDSESE